MNTKKLEPKIALKFKQFGSNVQTLREQKKMSIATLAKECELTPKVLIKIENGTWLDLDIITIHRLSNALDTPMHLMVESM